MKELKLKSDGTVDRRYTKEWSESGLFNLEKTPDLVKILVDQRKEMIEYITELHNKIDYMIHHNKICDFVNCLTANCTSDHK